jgi:hypothetical protein
MNAYLIPAQPGQLVVALQLEDGTLIEVALGPVEVVEVAMQLHALEILEGKFEQAVANAGRPVVQLEVVGV